jgi:hypothetical protein
MRKGIILAGASGTPMRGMNPLPDNKIFLIMSHSGKMNALPNFGDQRMIDRIRLIGIWGYRLKAGQFEPVDPSLPARKPIKKQDIPQDPYSAGCPGLNR